jgi:hypothetical protein
MARVSCKAVGREQLLLDLQRKRYAAALAAGDHEAALAATLAAGRLQPGNAAIWRDAATCALPLRRYDETIGHAMRAIACGATDIVLSDALAHAWWGKGDHEQAGRWAKKALSERDTRYRAGVLPDPRPARHPPPPGAATRDRNVIAFSLFGADARYGECAMLNAAEQPAVYPGWTCRFYVDDTVPEAILARLASLGAGIVRVDAELRGWPGTMWRFAAGDDAELDRILFRDADSVVSAREANAVAEWIDSGRSFHLMRDSGSHTMLILAGLWGMKAGALPPIRPMVAAFLAKPLNSRRFADQDFLQEHVWPLVRQDVLTHDSITGFLNPRPFPDGPPPAGFHVGLSEGAPSFSVATDLPEGASVRWHLVDAASGEPLTESHEATVRASKVTAHVPGRFARRIEAGTARVVVTRPAG